MPLLRNAKKALRQSQVKAGINSRLKSKMRTAIDRAQAKPSPETMSGAFSALDKALKHHILHSNKVARVKSQLSRLIK